MKCPPRGIFTSIRARKGAVSSVLFLVVEGPSGTMENAGLEADARFGGGGWGNAKNHASPFGG